MGWLSLMVPWDMLNEMFTVKYPNALRWEENCEATLTMLVQSPQPWKFEVSN